MDIFAILHFAIWKRLAQYTKQHALNLAKKNKNKKRRNKQFGQNFNPRGHQLYNRSNSAIPDVEE